MPDTRSRDVIAAVKAEVKRLTEAVEELRTVLARLEDGDDDRG